MGANAAEIVSIPKEDPKEDKEKSEQKQVRNVEEIARQYFKDDPILVDIAWCESRFRQYNSDGSTHRGEVNNRDVGVMQINEKFHLDRALKLGHDIYTPKGNMSYAKYLYERDGLTPWNSSAKCWNKSQIVN